MARRWSGTIAVEGVQTGDGRVIAEGALYWEDLPIPLRWTPEDEGSHFGAVVVGTIDTISRQGNNIVATGTIDDEGEQGAEVVRLMGEGLLRGVSIDPDDWQVVVVDTTITEADVEEAEAELMAMLAAAGDPDPGDGEDAGVVLFEDEAGAIVERLVRGRIRAATLVDTPAFIDAVIALDDAAVVEETDEEPEDDEEAVAASAAAGCGCGGTCGSCGPVVAAGGPDVPPAAWFTDPALTEPTPLTIEDGRVFGHIATWGTCHTGSPVGACVTPPHSAARYAYFRTGVRQTDGGDVTVGQLTLGGGHADLQLSYRGAAEHYDDVATALADVAAGEDGHGIWVAGALRPGVTDEQVAQLRAASPSGDWRNVGGQLELVAVHAVNVPGFPVARVAAGRAQALVAAGVLTRHQTAEATLTVDPHAVAAEVVRLMRAEQTAPLRRRLSAVGADRARQRLRNLAPTAS